MAKNLFKMSKTLSLALDPRPVTKIKLAEFHKIQSNIELNSQLEEAKKFIDRFHLSFIDDCIETIRHEVSWDSLFDALLKGDKNIIKEERIALIKTIQAIYENTPGYEYITTATPSRMMLEKLIPIYPNEKSLNVSASYLSSFHMNRQGLYGFKKGSIISRILYDNLTLYADNAAAWSRIKEACPEQAEKMLAALEKEDVTGNIEELFTAGGYSRCLTQKGITTYNTVLNGFSDENGIHHCGLSKMVNDLRKNENTKDLFEAKQWPVFSKLKKMIMQEMTESFSFIPKQFTSDVEMFKAIEEFSKQMSAPNIIGTIEEAISNLKNGIVSPEEILIFKDKASAISNSVYGKWNVIENVLEKYTEEHFEKKKDAKAFSADKTISIAKLQEIMKAYGYEQDILAFWTNLDLARDIRRLATEAIILERSLNGVEIKDRKELLPQMEEAFDNLSGTIAKLCMLLGGKLSKNVSIENNAFKYMEDELMLLHNECHFLFNTTRSWCTRKPYNTHKIELNFGFPNFGDGFAESVILKKGCMIFRREREYFLGIINKNDKPDIPELYANIENDSKMHALFSYSLRAMSITRILFSNANRDLFSGIGLDDELINGYEQKLYRTDTAFLHRLIGFTIKALHSYPSWKKINWSLGEPENYESWKEFSDKVSEQAVTVEMHRCSENTLFRMEEEGRIFLFKITSLGMKKYEKGVPTKDKMSEFFIRAVENIDNEGESRITLLNNCSVWYRPASIRHPFVHRKGDILVDKKDTNGNPIPGHLYKEIFHYYLNGEKNFKNLSQETKTMISSGLVKTKRARFDIVKDHRHTIDSYIFHIPVTVNTDAPLTLDTDANINSALQTLNDEANRMFADSGNVIGLTRGANHLVSWCVINREHGLIDEGDFDVIEERDNNGTVTQSLNYRTKLSQINAERKQRAKTWQERGDIAGIQDVYLKYVIREVARLSEKYNALIALEDMSSEICAKAITSRIEAVSYRKFEASLLDSLSCYIPDKCRPGEIVQYTVGNLGARNNTGQNGRVVFVSAARLQNTDPVTGFCNIFGKLGELNTKEKIRKFFSTFKSIEAKNDAVEFTFNYSDFGLNDLRDMKDDWTLRIQGERFSFELDENDKRNRKKLVVRQPALEIIEFAKTKKSNNKNLRDVLIDKELKAEELENVKKSFFLGLKTRQCAVIENEEIDYFVSSACDSKGETFMSGTKEGYPHYTDTVLAYNIAKKILK